MTGHIANDLGSLLALCVEPQLRREIEVWICEYFYTLLKVELSKHNMEMPYTLEQVRFSCFYLIEVTKGEKFPLKKWVTERD